MVYFILFVIGAVMLGAGAMLAPAWATTQPRIGTAAAFALALVVGGAVFWAHLFGWSTLVVDYLLFALVSMTLLGGTMAQVQQRTADGEAVDDAEVGWTGPEDLTFFGLVALLFAVPLGWMLFPRGDTAAANGLITLAARDGASFDSLAPYFPDTIGIFPPGFHALAAYLSAQLQQPIPQIHMAIGAVCGLLSIWTAYDFGSEIQDKRLGRAMALASLLSLGVLRLYFDGFYPQLMGVVFATAFATYALRVVRHHKPLDTLAAGLMLGAVLYVSPTMFVLTFAAYIVFLLANLLPKRVEKGIPPQQPTPFAYLGQWLGVPLIAFLGTLPWLVHVWSTLQIVFCRECGEWISGDVVLSREVFLVLQQGIWMLPLLLIGAMVGWRKHRTLVLWCVGWVIVAYFFLALPKSLFYLRWIQSGSAVYRMALIPTIPYALLGGIALLWLFERIPQWCRAMLRRTFYLQAILALFAIPAVLYFVINIGFADPKALTRADIATMNWLMENAPDAHVLNHPTDNWFVPATGINAIFAEFPSHITTSRNNSAARLELAYSWQVPDGRLFFLEKYEIDYILVPQWAAHPSEQAAEFLSGGEDNLANLPFLEVAFEQDGAVVYRVLK
jgi:hypothetical protein